MKPKNILIAIFGGPWYLWILALLVYLEFYLLLDTRNAFGWYRSPVALLAASTLIGLLPIVMGMLNIGKAGSVPMLMKPTYRSWIILGLFLAGAVFVSPMVAEVFQSHPVSLKKSGDIIPSVELFVQRLLGKSDGLHPYDEYYGFGYLLNPTYLPFQWLPFLIPEWLQFDYRWMVWIMFLIGLSFYQRYISEKNISWVWTVFFMVAPFFFVREMTHGHTGFITRNILSNTIELMDVGYYFILAYALLQGGVVMRAIAFLLPLLSRFSFLFWVPFYFLGTFLRENKRKAVLTATLIFAGVVGVYLLPFMTHDFNGISDNIFTRGQSHYTRAAFGAWQMHSQPDKPYSMKHGAGMAIYLYDREGDLMDRVEFARKLHLGVSVFAALLVGLFYYFFAYKRMSAGYYFLFGLKFYFAFFYAFIQVPYPYLYMVPLFLSLFIMAAVAGRNDP